MAHQITLPCEANSAFSSGSFRANDLSSFLEGGDIKLWDASGPGCVFLRQPFQSTWVHPSHLHIIALPISNNRNPNATWTLGRETRQGEWTSLGEVSNARAHIVPWAVQRRCDTVYQGEWLLQPGSLRPVWLVKFDRNHRRQKTYYSDHNSHSVGGDRIRTFLFLSNAAKFKVNINVNCHLPSKDQRQASFAGGRMLWNIKSCMVGQRKMRGNKNSPKLIAKAASNAT